MRRSPMPMQRVAILIKAADWAVRMPWLRPLVFRFLVHRLDSAYNAANIEPRRLEHIKWFGRHLDAFAERLVTQRPAAARAILRFVAAWARDTERRTKRDRAGAVAPSTIVIEPTDRCNLACPGCYAKSTRDGTDIPFDSLVEIVHQAIDMGVTLITLSGGEPFLRERKDQAVTRLAERFPDRGFLVYTNGTLIDEQTIERLALVGNVFPAISVEGFEHQTDSRRGQGVYEQTRRVRRQLAKAGVMTGFSATLTRENADAICTDAFLDRRIEEGDLFGWFFLLQPVGRAPRPDLAPTAEQRARLREAITRWRRQHRPVFLGDFWNDGLLAGGCIAGGRGYFHIYANGDISPCVFAPVACENVIDIINGKSEYQSLNDVVQRHPLFVRFRHEQARIHDRNRPCLLIDHPAAFRRICRAAEYTPAKNMPEGYLHGAIAEQIDDMAAAWRAKAAQLPELPTA